MIEVNRKRNKKKPFDWESFLPFIFTCIFFIGLSLGFWEGKKSGYRQAMSQSAKAIKTSLELTLTTLEDEKALIKLMRTE